MVIKIELPAVSEQRIEVYKYQIEQACEALRANLDAPVINVKSEHNEDQYNRDHLKKAEEGWSPPAPEIVEAWIRQFQNTFPMYGTDKQLASLLGITRYHSLREWRLGEKTVPYGIWRQFLVITGRVVQDITPVMGFF